MMEVHPNRPAATGVGGGELGELRPVEANPAALGERPVDRDGSLDEPRNGKSGLGDVTREDAKPKLHEKLPGRLGAPVPRRGENRLRQSRQPSLEQLAALGDVAPLS